MFKSKNIMLFVILGIILIFTVAYFAIANNISHAFVYNESQELYKSRMNLISSMSVLYGKKNIELFDEKDIVYITVQDLIDNHMLDADTDSGDYKDPTSDVKTLNGLKIRLTNKDGKITSKILNNEK